MSGGGHYVIRIANIDDFTNADLTSWTREKVRRECEMMKWMGDLVNLSVPIVYACDAQSPRPYMITNRLEGSVLADTFGALSYEAKVCIPSIHLLLNLT